MKQVYLVVSDECELYGVDLHIIGCFTKKEDAYAQMKRIEHTYELECFEINVDDENFRIPLWKYIE